MNENQRIGGAWAKAVERRAAVLALHKEADAAQSYADAVRENAHREWAKMAKEFEAAEKELYDAICGEGR